MFKAALLDEGLHFLAETTKNHFLYKKITKAGLAVA
jgi:hypothetical protein